MCDFYTPVLLFFLDLDEYGTGPHVIHKLVHLHESWTHDMQQRSKH